MLNNHFDTLSRSPGAAGALYLGFSSPTILNFVTATDTDHDSFPDALEALNGLTVGVKDNDVIARDDLFVMQLYRDILYREADAGGLAYWTQLLELNPSRESVASSFINSSEFQDIVDGVASLYLGTLGRMPDQAGLAHWIGALRAGVSFDNIRNAIVASEEFQTLYGSLDNMGFITRLYLNALDRAPDTQGLGYWQAQLAAGAGRGQVVAFFTNTEEFKANHSLEITATLTSLGLLGTLPDQSALDALVEDLSAGTPLINIIGTMLSSEQYLDCFL